MSSNGRPDRCLLRKCLASALSSHQLLVSFHAQNKKASSAIFIMAGMLGSQLTAKVLSPTLVVMSPSMVPYSTSLGLRRSWLRLLNFRRATPSRQASRHTANTTDRMMRPTSKGKFCVPEKDFSGNGGENGCKDHCLLILLILITNTLTGSSRSWPQSLTSVKTKR